MRGEHRDDGGLFSYVSLEDRVPKRHPLRKMRRLVDEALRNLDCVFDDLYAASGRPSFLRNACCALRCCRSSSPCAANGS